MGIVKNEQDVKQRSQFLKYESGDGGNSLILKSHLYQIDSHFLKSVMRSVICKGEDCLYCGAGYPLNSEYNYFVDLNGEQGFLNIKGSVFFDIQKICKAQKKDVRQISWTVIKTGDGLNTEYTVTKDDNLHADDYKRIMDAVDATTDKLVGMMEKHEEELNENYVTYLKDIKQQTTTKKQAPVVPDDEPDLGDNSGEPEVKPEEIPF